MRTRTTVGLPTATTLALATLLLGSGAAFSQAPLPGDPSGAAAALTLVGMATGEPEKDSLGLTVPPPATCLAPRFSDRPQSVGPATGDPEKDSLGFVVLGEEPCPAASQPH